MEDRVEDQADHQETLASTADDDQMGYYISTFNHWGRILLHLHRRWAHSPIAEEATAQLQRSGHPPFAEAVGQTR